MYLNWHEELLEFKNRTTPSFCKTTINQKSNITTKRTPIGVTNVQRPSPASFPTVLFITFPSLTYSTELQPPFPLLLAWNRHSGKYILCRLSSCCYSWFHKWWWNGQESEGVNGKRWLLHATTVFPAFSFVIDNTGWLETADGRVNINLH